MSNCIICNKELTTWNVPSKSVRVLKDGNEICSPCLQDLSNKVPGIQVKNFSKDEFLLEKNEFEIRVKKFDEKFINLRFGDVTNSVVKKAIKDIFPILLENEDIQGAAYMTDKESNMGAIFATNQRLICITRGLLIRTKIEDFPFSKINSIEITKGFLSSTIKIHVSGNTSEFSLIDKDSALKLVEYSRMKRDEPVQKTNLEIDNSNDSDKIISQIEKLSGLKDKGIISEEEFQVKKTELLDRL
jgi:hypothetical protein